MTALISYGQRCGVSRGGYVDFWLAMKGGNAVHREIRWIFPGVDLARIPNLCANSNCLWLEAVV